MDGKINKKTIAIIAVIAILLVAAISLTAVFLNDQGETEATVGDTSASNGSEEQNAQDQRSSEENNNEEEQQPAEESEEATDDNEETEVARTDNNADVDADNDNDNNDNDNDADTTTATDDSQTVLVDEEVQTATELVNAGWNNTEIGLSQLANVEALNPELTSKLEVSTTKIENQNVEVEYKITISNSSDIDAKQIMVSMDIPEGVEFVSAENANYHEELGKVIWVIDVNANNSTELTLKVKNTIYRGEFTAVAVVDGAETNEVTTTVDDTEAPKITLYPSTNPEGKRTIGKDGEYSEISFAFEDNWMLKEYEINDTLVKMTPDKWSNANYMNIKDFLVEGENIIILRDMAGNETEFTFIYDITAPKYKYLGIARNTSKEDKRNQQYAKVGDSVRVLVAFPEKLDVIPTVKMFGKEYEATYRPQSSNPSSNTYYYMADIKMTDDMPEGEIPFEIYGYADKAGNVGLNLANADINLKEYPRVILDKTNPELIIKGNEGKEGCITVGKDGEYSQISFKLFDNIALDKIEINGNLIDKPAVQWNDANYMNIKQYLKEGENIVVLTDMAGNETELTFIYDVTAPEHTNLGIFNRSHWEEGNMKVATTGDLIRLFVAFPEMLDVEPTATIFGEDGRETKIQLTYDSKAKWYSKDFRITDDMNLPEGEIKFEISGYTDKAGNVGETLNNDSDMNEKYPEVVYDVTAPELAAMGIFNWSNENDDMDIEDDEEVATLGDHIRLFVTFSEDLGTLPKVDIYGEDDTVTTLDLKWSTAAKYYFVEFDISEDMKLPEGKIQYKIYGYADEAGNTGNDITQDQTTDSRYPEVIYDTTAPYAGVEDESHPLYILNVSDANRRKWIRNGETLRVEANFNEELSPYSTPVLTIGTDDNVQTKDFRYRGYSNGKYVYVADIKIDNDELQLEDGTEIPFTVTEAFDVAGNEVTLDNDDVTYTSQYGQVVYDNNAPEYFTVGILNDTHYGTKEDLTVATTGDRIRLRVSFQEMLAVEPTVEIIGKDGTTIKVACTYREQSSGENYFMYMADFVITEEMKLPEGEIQFRISGYADEAGNVGEVITEEDINEKAYPGVVYDTTAPKATKVQLWDKEDEETETIRNGQTVRVMVTFDEKLETLPTLTIGNLTTTMKPTSDGKDGTIYQADIKIAEDEETIPEGRLPFTISGYTDEAGNVGADITEESENVTGIIYDRTNPKLTIKGNEGEEGAITVGNDGEYSQISFKLFDNYALGEIEINGKIIEKPAVQWNDANYMNIKQYLKEGKNTVILRDLAGNKDELTFIYDTTKPTITVKEGEKYTIGSDGEYSKISLKFHDNNTLKEYVINGTVVGLAKDSWGDANYTGKLDSQLKEGENTVILRDMAGNKDTLTFIYDITSPEAKVTFSNNNGNAMTNKDVTVTLKANESIKNIEGWTRVDDKTFIKEYSENGKYSVEIEDKAGNKATIKFEVKRIDKVAPEAKVTFSNNNGNAMTNEDVTATLTANESIKNIEGWTRVDDKTFTKVYSENGKYSVEIEDKAGNKATIKFEVKRIDKVSPDATITFSNNNGNAMTKEDVTVTLTATESIKDIDGWTRVDDKTFTKVYSQNEKNCIVEIEDKAGNKAVKKFEVKRIDKVSPDAEFTFSNNNGDVTVTLTANESIKDIDGWTRVTDKIYTKVYSKEGSYSVLIEDKAGNRALKNFEVTK